MAVTLTGSYGLMTRLGFYGQEYIRVCTSFGSALDTSISNLYGSYGDANDVSAIDSLFAQKTAFRGSYSTWLSSLTQDASATVVSQVNRDTPLTQQQLSNALQILISQFKSGSQSINRPTTSLTFTQGGSNKGDGVIVGSNVNQYGDPLDMVLPETINFTCSADFSSGSATLYQESFTLAGQPILAATAYNYPGGSGATGTVKLQDAAVNGLIKDGGFASWSTNTPTYWTIATGAATTNIVKSGSPIRGNYALEFLSDGTTLTKINQPVTLSPNTVYAVNLWAKQSALDSSGQFRVRLCDGSGNTINSDAGNSLTTTVNTNGTGSGIGTGWTQIQAFFQTPRQLPTGSSVYLELGYTTSPASSITTTIDLVGFAVAQQLYAGGPWVQGFSKGLTGPNAKGDTIALVVANNAPNASFVRFLDRIFNMRQLGPTYYLPSSGSPTISDSLL